MGLAMAGAVRRLSHPWSNLKSGHVPHLGRSSQAEKENAAGHHNLTPAFPFGDTALHSFFTHMLCFPDHLPIPDVFHRDTGPGRPGSAHPAQLGIPGLEPESLVLGPPASVLVTRALCSQAPRALPRDVLWKQEWHVGATWLGESC